MATRKPNPQTGKLLLAIGMVLVSAGVVGCGSATNASNGAGDAVQQKLLNVSYDPTRELSREINSAFIPHYEKEADVRLEIKQSHAGSGSQARSIIDGQKADVATLAMFVDTNAIHKKGLIADGWVDRLPNRSLPYTSTIVFVVRAGNPKQIKDWSDLVRDGVQTITPNPKTSGNGKLSLLAAWGSVIADGGTENQAREFIAQLYKQVPVLDSAARGSTTTFAQKKIGDVHLTWENEAYMEVSEFADEALEIVYPRHSILAEPYVAVVDTVVDRKGTRAAAEAYLKFLYSKEGQQIIAKHHYRPSDPQVAQQHLGKLPPIELFSISKIAKDWDDAQAKFFADGAIFDQVFKR